MSNQVTLRFKSEAEKNRFLDEFAGGWGENYVIVDWPLTKDLYETDVVDVSMFTETHSP